MKTTKKILRTISAIILISCAVSFAIGANEIKAISLILLLGFGVFLVGISFNN